MLLLSSLVAPCPLRSFAPSPRATAATRASAVDQLSECGAPHSRSHLLDALARLDAAIHSLQPQMPATPLLDACLGVCHALTGPGGPSSLPQDVQQLSEAAMAFGWEDSAQLKQHLFDAQLWDDALEALGLATTQSDTGASRLLAIEAAQAISASARFIMLEKSEQLKAIDHLERETMHPSFLQARQAALAVARRPRAQVSSSTDAYALARQRSRAKDFVAVPPAAMDDEAIIRALYECAVQHLEGTLLEPLGFPRSKLGLRSLLASTRAAGSERGVAALGRLWHAAIEPGPLIVTRPCSGDVSMHTLVVVFSSLGWNGVVRAEWGATLRGTGDDRLVVAHALDTAQSWFQTNPLTGEFDEGSWWDSRLEQLCAPYQKVCILGESMGASGALRFAKHATGSVVALVPQIDVRDFSSTYAGRADFTDERKSRLRDAIHDACAGTTARVVVHVGRDPPDLRQLEYLPRGSDLLRVVKHDFPGHSLGGGLKAQGSLRKVVLHDLLGHSYRLPAVSTGS